MWRDVIPRGGRRDPYGVSRFNFPELTPTPPSLPSLLFFIQIGCRRGGYAPAKHRSDAERGCDAIA